MISAPGTEIPPSFSDNYMLSLNENDSSPKLKFKKIKSLVSSLGIKIAFDDKNWHTRHTLFSNSLLENLCIIRATNLIFIIYIQIKLNTIHITLCPHDGEFVYLWEMILLALKSRNIELFFKTNFRFSCLLVRDPMGGVPVS